MKIKKVKLPRKRKKRFIKSESKSNYLVCKILNEIVIEEKGDCSKNRNFYKYKRTERSHTGFKIIGKW